MGTYMRAILGLIIFLIFSVQVIIIFSYNLQLILEAVLVCDNAN